MAQYRYFFKHFLRKPQKLIVSNIIKAHLKSFFQSIMWMQQQSIVRYVVSN